ncbi:MAG: benzoyl-CoA reductase subunit D [Deltaproteobacteria bacterium]|nr:benzoyl-CoA reductase subunit D [Deltaproteobacteria bacterium]
MTFYTAGIDVGSSSIKATLMGFNDQGDDEKLLAFEVEKIRKRNIKDVIQSCYRRMLERLKLNEKQIAYVASTGEGEMVDFRKGHFYSMTCHARGALFLVPQVRAVVDIGALHSKALVMDERSKVLAYRMTSQCASGTGQFLENIGRYLGVTLADIGELSLKADKPEMPSGICAVLAETDVINMVSRGITTQNILKGIHLSMARRLVNLLKMLKADGDVLLTGGLSQDEGLRCAIDELAEKDGLNVRIGAHELSIFAGALGAALWAGFRHVRLSGLRGGTHERNNPSM